ncbi:hypothetical protein L861_12920 [Litchfieldella anticariensis FP35 = DSM 16096]|uniref:Glycosyl transferase family 1 domain-containing protein n=1 Tax=Litchfieldella anticariensis (strain DSM 16096 / CECT 5854 / CIP 108499 / LMG 22089 / FP35) TaxID=1121939 RepID=S2KZ41_LITA3|nr:hypothetical protein L861_12920 [Halomonas anticariensis FP35 = DSM 16096]
MTVASRARALVEAMGILGYLKRHDIRVVHCHKSSDLRLGALLKTLRPGLRLFFTDHMGVTRPKKDLYHRWAYGKLTRLFSISEATRERNLKAFPLPSERIHRLYLGIDPDPYLPVLDEAAREALRAELGISQGAVAIGLPGRLTLGKGQQLWLEALAVLRDRYPDRHFHGVIIGGTRADDGANVPYVETLEKLVVSLRLADCVSFAGFRRDLPRVFEALEIVCVPSRNEAFGLTVIEAMAAGKAVIGADSGAIPELLTTRCGRLAPPGDAGAWAEAMAELVADGALRERLGREACLVARNDFTLGAHVERLIAEYESA